SNIQRTTQVSCRWSAGDGIFASTYWRGWTSCGGFLPNRAGSDRHDCWPHEAKKCYNFRLAMSAPLTASCMSTWTATLLLVVDRYSQVFGAAVHQYSQLIRNLNPSLIAMIQLKPGIPPAS